VVSAEVEEKELKARNYREKIDGNLSSAGASFRLSFPTLPLCRGWLAGLAGRDRLAGWLAGAEFDFRVSMFFQIREEERAPGIRSRS